MILFVHSLSNDKISSQISIILWLFGPYQYIRNVFLTKKHTCTHNFKKHEKHVLQKKYKKNI